MKEKKINGISYAIKTNNYVGLLFFALVLASLLYIIKTESHIFKEVEPTIKSISTTQELPEIIDEENDTIKKLRTYLNKGNINTKEIYQSMYVKDGIEVNNINDESLLYSSYLYLINNTEYNNKRDITCEEANLINLSNDIIECGGSNNTLSTYTVYYNINKQLLKKTVRDLYNRNIFEFKNFYINYDNACYYINDEYLCVSKEYEDSNSYGQTQFVKAFKYNDRIEIVEKYSFINEGNKYRSFDSDEIGEDSYISTYKLINGNYYYYGTEVYEKN